MLKLVVAVAFGPFALGQEITDPDQIAALLAGPYAANFMQVAGGTDAGSSPGGSAPQTASGGNWSSASGPPSGTPATTPAYYLNETNFVLSKWTGTAWTAIASLLAPPAGSVTAPANTVPPAITGTAQVGQTLTRTAGTWTQSPTLAGQWKRNGTAIAGATGATYALVTADLGAVISYTETATNSAGTASSTSAGTAAVIAAVITPPANTVLPAISGTAQVGQTLTAGNGTWSNSPTSYAYQWKRAGTAISGATAQTYGPVSADIGNALTVTVAATNAGGSASATSAATAAVIDVTPVLAALALSNQNAAPGAAFTSTISGKTAGSTLAATSSDGTAMTVSGTTLSGTFAAVGTPNVTLTETLAGATGSPKSTTLPITVSTAAPSGLAADLNDPMNVAIL